MLGMEVSRLFRFVCWLDGGKQTLFAALVMGWRWAVQSAAISLT